MVFDHEVQFPKAFHLLFTLRPLESDNFPIGRPLDFNLFLFYYRSLFTIFILPVLFQGFGTKPSLDSLFKLHGAKGNFLQLVSAYWNNQHVGFDANGDLTPAETT